MKTQILERAEASVAAVDNLLTKLDSLNNDQKTLSESIAASKANEADILASDAKEGPKINSLLRVRAELDVRSASLAKVGGEIAATQEELRIAGQKANLFLGALIDALTVARRERVTELLKGIFIERAIKELTSYLPYSLLLQEVEPGVERLQFYPVARVSDNVATARKVRPTFDALKSLVESEEHIELVVGAAW